LGKEIECPVNNCSAHSGIIKTQEFHDQELKRLDGLTEQIFLKLDNISNRLIARPGWFVTFIIGLLTSLLTMSLTIMGFVLRK
jgi:hypothetical protein